MNHKYFIKIFIIVILDICRSILSKKTLFEVEKNVQNKVQTGRNS